MRWRLVDRVERLEPWKRADGVKAVSLEEYSLMKPFGRKGAFPESLVLECCVELVRWMVAASSEFTRASVLAGAEGFGFPAVAGMGDVIELSASVAARDGARLAADCRARAAGSTVGAGRLTFEIVPLAGSFDPELVRGMWREIHGEA